MKDTQPSQSNLQNNIIGKGKEWETTDNIYETYDIIRIYSVEDIARAYPFSWLVGKRKYFEEAGEKGFGPLANKYKRLAAKAESEAESRP